MTLTPGTISRLRVVYSGMINSPFSKFYLYSSMRKLLLARLHADAALNTSSHCLREQCSYSCHIDYG